MKLILAFLLLCSLASQSQNGGQFYENNVAKVQYISNDATTVKLLVISKQNCTADYKVDFGPVQTVSIAAYDTAEFIVPITSATFKAKAESQTTCTNQPDMGWVEIIISLVINPNVLPIKLISFTGVQKDNQVFLKWEVVNETVGKFEIEESKNGQVFNTLATINKLQGLGTKIYNSNTTLAGITYYRLKMFDENNHISYSKIITFRGTKAVKFKLYSNPVIDNKLVFALSGSKNEQVKISIINMRGQIMLNKIISISAGENLIDLPFNSTKGLYQLIIKTNTETYNQKFIL